MFQTFEATSSPEQGPPRLRALRRELAAEGLDGYLVPRADAHQGEYVAAHDDRLAWLTGFTGSAGFCAVLQEIAGVFIDGRYRVQVKAQVAPDFTPVYWPETKLGPWLAQHLPHGGKVGFDPWLHTAKEIETVETAVEGKGIHLAPSPNLIDRIWEDQPPPPMGRVMVQPVELAGESSADKRARIARAVHEAGQTATVLTLPDSLCWLLNIRGADVPKNPVVHGFAILHADARMDLFIAPAKVAEITFDESVTTYPPEAFTTALAALKGPVRVDKATAPLAVSHLLKDAGIEVAWGDDPCILPKARKNDVELAATAEAHLRDGAAMVEFLAWLDREAPKGKLTEIEVVKSLEGFRRATNALHDISFDTICGAGPNGAIVHYRVTEGTNRKVNPGELLLIDSGGQYVDGTTDITRTVAVGAATEEQRACFTRVLQGVIAISRVRWPRGLSGRDLDSLARAPLWMAGMDYDHGTGHGVGVFLSVHEGPQRIARISEIPLEPGMMLSNEPGYYREGAFGIRIENLIVVREAPKLGNERDQLCFETITWVPIDRRLIDAGLLAPGERSWINRYHAEVRDKIGPRVSPQAKTWLDAATRPI
jgi:Xaa-Pro aminopeptidase